MIDKPPDPLAALLPDAEAVVSRLAVVARERRFLRRLLTLIVQGRDELAYREANASPTTPAAITGQRGDAT